MRWRVRRGEPTRDRVQALFSAALITPLHGDVSTGAARAAEARALAEKTDDPIAHAGVAMADGITALMRWRSQALPSVTSRMRCAPAMTTTSKSMRCSCWDGPWSLPATPAARSSWQEKALALATSRGETVYRSYALWEFGIRWFQHGRLDRAEQLLQEGLRVAQLINDQRNAAGCLEGLAWIAAQRDNPRALR